MTIWISLPEFFIPSDVGYQEAQDVDALYNRIYSAFNMKSEIESDKLNIPRIKGIETEDLIANTVIQTLIKGSSISGEAVEMLVDCRSSAAIGGSAPTYKLATKSGLQKSLPFCISGQAGSEVGQAINFLNVLDLDPNKITIISAVQRVAPQDNRISKDYYTYADAAAALAVASKPMPFAKNFQVLSVSSMQSKNIIDFDWTNFLEDLMYKTGIKKNTVKWAILHNIPQSLRQPYYRAFSQVNWLKRSTYLSVDFGCVDVLISFRQAFLSDLIKPSEIGALLFPGRFGTIVTVLLKPEWDVV